MNAKDRLRKTVEDLIEERDMLRESRDRVIDEAKELSVELLAARNERDEARKCAEEFRNLCVGDVSFPWETEA